MMSASGAADSNTATSLGIRMKREAIQLPRFVSGGDMNKKQMQVKFVLVPVVREELKVPKLPTPSRMYQGKAKNGPITPRVKQ